MAELLVVAHAIAPILNGMVTAYKLINSISKAGNEAQDLVNQLRATQAVLVALRSTLNTQHRSQEFLSIWSPPAKTTLRSLRMTIGRMNEKLGGTNWKRSSVVQIPFLKRAKWPFEREEGLILQLQFQSYMQMLSIVQTAFVTGTAQVAVQSAKQVDDIFTSVGSLPVSESQDNLHEDDLPISEFPSSTLSTETADTLLPDDSASQLNVNAIPRPSLSKPNSWFTLPTIRAPPRKSAASSKILEFLRESFVYKVDYFVISSCSDMSISEGDKDRLGPGELILGVSKSTDRIWIVFRPTIAPSKESRWYLTASQLANSSRGDHLKSHRGLRGESALQTLGGDFTGHEENYVLHEVRAATPDTRNNKSTTLIQEDLLIVKEWSPNEMSQGLLDTQRFNKSSPLPSDLSISRYFLYATRIILNEYKEENKRREEEGKQKELLAAATRSASRMNRSTSRISRSALRLSRSPSTRLGD